MKGGVRSCRLGTEERGRQGGPRGARGIRTRRPLQRVRREDGTGQRTGKRLPREPVVHLLLPFPCRFPGGAEALGKN